MFIAFNEISWVPRQWCNCEFMMHDASAHHRTKYAPEEQHNSIQLRTHSSTLRAIRPSLRLNPSCLTRHFSSLASASAWQELLKLSWRKNYHDRWIHKCREIIIIIVGGCDLFSLRRFYTKNRRVWIFNESNTDKDCMRHMQTIPFSWETLPKSTIQVWCNRLNQWDRDSINVSLSWKDIGSFKMRNSWGMLLSSSGSIHPEQSVELD